MNGNTRHSKRGVPNRRRSIDQLIARMFGAWRSYTRDVNKGNVNDHDKSRHKKVHPVPVLCRRKSIERRAKLKHVVYNEAEASRTCIESPISSGGPLGVTGLRNMGNTCYMNAVLQVLGNLDDFRDFVLTNASSSGLVSTEEKVLNHVKKEGAVTSHDKDRQLAKKWTSVSANSTSIEQELYTLMCAMWSGQHSLVIPNGFLKAMWQHIPNFRGNQQHDAQEFICEMLNRLEDELGNESPSTSSKRDRTHRKELLGALRSGKNDLRRALNSDVISSLFRGQLCSRVRCLKCTIASDTVEPFFDLSLEFPLLYQLGHEPTRCGQDPSTLECSLLDMLDAFTAPEQLGDVYICELCNRSSSTRTYCPAEKQLMIRDLPKILRLHLKRFSWRGRGKREKISIYVKYPQMLDIKDYVSNQPSSSNSSMSKKSTIYQLTSVVIHHGRGFNSGHYTAYCWNSVGNFWLHCNDHKLELAAVEDVLTSQAYMLFYTRLDEKGEKPVTNGVPVPVIGRRRSAPSTASRTTPVKNDTPANRARNTKRKVQSLTSSLPYRKRLRRSTRQSGNLSDKAR